MNEKRFDPLRGVAVQPTKSYDPRRAAAETKKQRTRHKLILAADEVMRTQGWSTTVEAIAAEAGVSTATFYSFYRSRNELCADAFTELVLKPLEEQTTDDQDMSEKIQLFIDLCSNRQSLVRAMMAARFERSGISQIAESFTEIGSFITSLKWLVPYHGRTRYEQKVASMGTLFLLDAIASGKQITRDDVDELARLIQFTSSQR